MRQGKKPAQFEVEQAGYAFLFMFYMLFFYFFILSLYQSRVILTYKKEHDFLSMNYVLSED